MSEFVFKEVDEEGLDVLNVVSEAKSFNEWMYKTVSKHCSGAVLEIGSGIGNISEQFLKNGFNLTVSDIRDNYCGYLEKNLKQFPNLKGIVKMDLTDPEFDTKFAHLLGTFDAVFAMNVVEHILDDKLALANAKKLLKQGGKCIILVPAYQFLYNKFDTELEHYRRYTQKSLNKIFLDNDYKIVHNQYFNLAGIPGWYVSGKLQGNKTIPAGQMKLYDLLVPIFKLADLLTFNTMGLSVITVGQKK